MRLFQYDECELLLLTVDDIGFIIEILFDFLLNGKIFLAIEIFEDTKVSHEDDVFQISCDQIHFKLKLASRRLEDRNRFETLLRAKTDYNRWLTQFYDHFLEVKILLSASDAETEAYISDTCSEISGFSMSSRTSVNSRRVFNKCCIHKYQNLKTDVN